MKYYFLSSRLSSGNYEALLQWALESCTKFSLVWRASLPFNKKAKNIEIKLKRYLLKEEKTNQWPGTKILGLADNILRLYKITRESIEILKVAGGIYNWQSPDFPEDLAFYKSVGRAWFGSVAHEKMSFFPEPAFSQNEIIKRIGKIRIEEKLIEVDS